MLGLNTGAQFSNFCEMFDEQRVLRRPSGNLRPRLVSSV